MHKASIVEHGPAIRPQAWLAIGNRESQRAGLAREEWRAGPELEHVEGRLLVGQLGILKLGLLHLGRSEDDVYELDRLVAAIGQHVPSHRAEAALIRIEIDLHIDICDPRLWRLLGAAVPLLV